MECLKSLRYNFIIISLTCVIALMAAYVGEYLFKLQPCALCLYQRYIFMTILAISTLGFFLKHKILLLVCACGFALCATVALYQVGVEEHILKLPGVCKSVGFDGTLEDLKSQLITKPVIPCDHVEWRLFGLSMAAYNGIFCLIMIVLSCWFYRGHRNEK